MMQDQDENKLFKAILENYSAPRADDGFSTRVIQTLERPQKIARARRIALSLGAIFGGAFAVAQMPLLLNWAQHKFRSPNIAPLDIHTSLLPGHDISVLLAAGFGMLVVATVYHFMFFSERF